MRKIEGRIWQELEGLLHSLCMRFPSDHPTEESFCTMSSDQHSRGTETTGRRYRNESGLPLNRRVVMKAAAGLTATLMAGATAMTPAIRPNVTKAQEAEGTRARDWFPEENVTLRSVGGGDGWTTFQTEFPFWAIGVGWDRSVGWWPAVDMQVSADGETWSDVFTLVGRDDGGPVPADGRIYTDLYFADGEQHIRYRIRDAEDNPVTLDGFKITYIDPTDGPWEADRGDTIMRTASTASTTSTNTDTDVPPTIITRAQWGANESLRFENGEEIWPPEYQTVQHAIVHHAAVNYGTDGYNAVRSIYYYHCVTQGWGDIGYNYLVDVRGNIFEGRVGGANVIGGHAYEYANGSSGICVMGDFSYQDAPAAAKAALAHILAYVTRDLDTYARRPFHQHPNLPTICGHRDVVQSTCPGDGLYDDLPYLRDTVAATLDAGRLDSGNPGGIVPGDRVKVVTEDGNPLNMRSGAGEDKPVNGTIPNGTYLQIEQGPISTPSDNWYRVTYRGTTGWVSATYLIVDPDDADPTFDYTFGVNIRVKGSSYLRSTPSTSGSVVATVPAGAWGFVMAGPTNANGYTWYQLRTQSHGTGWMATTGFELAPVYNPTPQFSVGQAVVATTSAPIRVRPGIAQTASGTAAAGTNLVVSVAPIAVTDRIWYGVHSQATGGGWMEQGHLRAGSGVPAGPVTAVGQQFQVTEALNMRSGAGTNYGIIATLPAGTTGSVIGGPSNASGYTWWQVRTSSGQQGWVVSNWIVRLSSSNPGNPSGFEKGVSVRTSIAVNLRQDAGTNYPIVATLSSNANGVITDGPRVATGYTWWKIRATTGQEGWAVQDYLVRTTGPGQPPPSDKFEIGEGFRAPKSVIRISSPNNVNQRIDPLPAGATGTITDGPVNSSGYVWWQTDTSLGRGWSPEQYLDPYQKFEIGERVVNPKAVIRIASPDNIRQRIDPLPAGTVGTVSDGPVAAGGYIWYQTETSLGRGWSPEQFLETSPKFEIGDPFTTPKSVIRIESPNNIRLRIDPLSAGASGTIVDGPVAAGGYVWYQTETSSGRGWSPEEYLDHQ